MKPVVAAFVLFASQVANTASTQAQKTQAIAVRVDATKRSAAVTPYEYGMFIEPIGGLVARTLWAEMLDDRKFYYPIGPAASDVPPPVSAEGRPGIVYRKWRPIGGDVAVKMDTQHPYAGTHSARRGIPQPCHRHRPKRDRDCPRPAVCRQAKAEWRAGRGGVGGVGLGRSAAGPAGRAVADARRGLERGQLCVHADRVRGRCTDGDHRHRPHHRHRHGRVPGRCGVADPADNINGWRADTTAIAKSLNSGFWRLPGRNFLSDWDWHEAIGPRDARPPMFDHA